jgi:hypothetical protein
MRGFDVLAFMQMAKVKPVVRRPPPHGAPDGTYCCFVREIRYWSGPRAGETESLEGGDWELQVITDRNLLWEYEDANSLHNGLPLELIYRPNGSDQLVAHSQNLGLVLRIVLGASQDSVPTTFTALGANIVLTGIAYFQPRVTP